MATRAMATTTAPMRASGVTVRAIGGKGSRRRCVGATGAGGRPWVGDGVGDEPREDGADGDDAFERGGRASVEKQSSRRRRREGDVGVRGCADWEAQQLWARFGSLCVLTPMGTLLGTTAIVSKILMGNPETISVHRCPVRCWGSWLALGNGYIVGISHYDVDIDKVNKPFLPVASGELSVFAAWAFCAITALGGAAIVTATSER